MYDETEPIRREAVATINAAVVTECPDFERSRLEAKYGQVWNTEELSQDFEVLGFMAPLVAVRRKSDDQKGSLLFQHMPRFYFDFQGFRTGFCVLFHSPRRLRRGEWWGILGLLILLVTILVYLF